MVYSEAILNRLPPTLLHPALLMKNALRLILMALLAWYACPLSLLASPVISEFLASNRENLAAASGKTEDWIEIRNTSNQAISLAGYHLTDDPDQPALWALPAAEIEPNGFIVIFASGEDLSDPAEEWHTNFRLARGGGYLALMSPEGSVASAFENYPPQQSDISYGISGSDIVYFDRPTPGEANAARGYAGIVSDTKFSVDRGYYEDPIQVEITTETEGVRIIYTTDGRVPSEGTPFTGPIGDDYAGPITIDKTTTLRAMALKDGYRPSNVDTQTYLFLKDVIRQRGEHLEQNWGHGEDADYEMDPNIVNDPRWKDTIIDDFKTLPALSIVVEPEKFFSLNKGIYPGLIGAEGIDIPASAEMLHPDGKEGFQIDCAVRIVGQTSPNRWKIKKLSMRLRFDEEFGPGTLRYPVYDDPDAVDEFNTLTVDARHNNTWAYQGGSEPTEQRRRAQYLRDQTAADLHRAMGGHSPHGRYVFTFVNGVFWGIYNLHERPDDAFNATYQGGDRSEWSVLRHGTVTVSGEDSLRKYRDLASLARNASASDVYAQVQEQLDIDDFISYMLVNLGLGNGDWGPKNYYVSLNPLDGKWRYHSWDAEKVFQRLNDDKTTSNDATGPTGIHQSLSKNEDYRMRFADLVHKHFFRGGAMSVEGLQKAYRRRTDEIDRAVILESARWGDSANGVTTPYTKEDWDRQRDWIMDEYFPERVDIALAQFERRGWLGDLDSPTFAEHGGYFEKGYAVNIRKPLFAGGSPYYTVDGTDPRLPGGGLADTAMNYSGPVVLDETTTVKARLYKGGLFHNQWSALLEATFVIGANPATSRNLMITMINFHPGATDAEEKAAGFSRKDFEFIGLSNISEDPVSLLELELVEGIRFDFSQAAMTRIEAGQVIFLVKNRAAFEHRYGTAFAIAGEYRGSLSNDGERLLLEAGENSIANFAYNDNSEWPEGTDGDGAYLILRNPGSRPDSSKAGSWRASTAEDSPSGMGGPAPGGGDLTYASWSRLAFAEGPARTGPNEDADGDRYVNYLEFLLGGDPDDPTSTPSINVSARSDGLPTFEISRRVGVKDPITLETSRELISWREVSGLELESLGREPGPDASTEIQRYRVLQLTRDTLWTERFVRIRARVAED